MKIKKSVRFVLKKAYSGLYAGFFIAAHDRLTTTLH